MAMVELDGTGGCASSPTHRVYTCTCNSPASMVVHVCVVATKYEIHVYTVPRSDIIHNRASTVEQEDT